MSQATREAYARASSKVIHLQCVELRNAQFPLGVLRMVNHSVDVTITLESGAPLNGGLPATFIGRGMDISEPARSDEPDSPFSIRFDGVDGATQGAIYNARQAGAPVYATVRPVAYDVLTETPLDPIGALHLELQSALTDMDTVILTLGYSNSANDAFPFKFYNPTTHGGLYT